MAGVDRLGGWPYFKGKQSRLEPTCWASLFEARDETGLTPAADHRRFIASCRRPSGLYADHPEQPPNLAVNGLLALLSRARPSLIDRAAGDALVSALADVAGLRLGQSPEFKQDNSLRGWPWIAGTFSWVEPTSWCLLALKKWTAATSSSEPTRIDQEAVRARIAEAEAMLADRCAPGGGWNYGNGNVLDQDLRPYVPTTALALLALQDRRDQPAVEQSVRYLRDQAVTEDSGLALGLVLICFHVLGLAVGPIRDRLLSCWDRGAFLGNLHATAIALYALTVDDHGAAAFRL
jgi:hypothetical protein